MMVHLLSTLLLLLLLTLSPNPVTSELALESGYSVSTVIDFNKYENPSTVHPFALLPRRRSTAGDDALLLLDSTNSAFYSLPIPISQESEVRLFSGKGVAGFSDGDKTTAMFDKPRSFAIDGGDNVYVADKTNHAIRKINTSDPGVFIVDQVFREDHIHPEELDFLPFDYRRDVEETLALAVKTTTERTAKHCGTVLQLFLGCCTKTGLVDTRCCLNATFDNWNRPSRGGKQVAMPSVQGQENSIASIKRRFLF